MGWHCVRSILAPADLHNIYQQAAKDTHTTLAGPVARLHISEIVATTDLLCIQQQTSEDAPTAFAGPVARLDTCTPPVSTASSDANRSVLEHDPGLGARLAEFLYVVALLANHEKPAA